MARFRQFTKRQLWQRFLVQKVPTFYMIVDKNIGSAISIETPPVGFLLKFSNV
jgi:hypothetical protein